MTRGRLIFIGGGGLIACFGIFQLFKHKVSSQIKNTTAFKEAMEIVKKHSGAIYLLGQPITESTAKFNTLGPRFGYATEFKVNVSGPKSNGILFCMFASDNNDKEVIDSIQLQIGKDDSKRLVIKKSSKEQKSCS